MSKNLIPEIAKMLGVELGEEFKVRSIFGGIPNNKIYHFGTKELFYTHEKNQNKIKDEYTLTELINGDCKIIKLPWKPKKGDVYFTFELLGGKWVVRSFWWGGFPNEYALFDKGWVYRTREEAEAALPKVAAEIGVDYEL
ncbi:hypothetical protein [uncultured Phascolarctobacterium sp.]|uniref:hypothetical protein n=1 Tax=uncultured Phascolarctobacterium sp. TaxID=512296 RepID=UPI0025EEE77E|nr:hypothetical protein [uncultured Phascolarctobacterium sp.]